MGSHCTNCDRDYLPPRAICPNCPGGQLTWVEFNDKGKLVVFTSHFARYNFKLRAGWVGNPTCK